MMNPRKQLAQAKRELKALRKSNVKITVTGPDDTRLRDAATFLVTVAGQNQKGVAPKSAVQNLADAL